MMSGLSTLVSMKCSNVTFFTMPLPTFAPAQHFMRAPFSALDMRTFLIVYLVTNGQFEFIMQHSRRCNIFNDVKHSSELAQRPNRYTTKVLKLSTRFNQRIESATHCDPLHCKLDTRMLVASKLINLVSA